jgi:hypothetical protein
MIKIIRRKFIMRKLFSFLLTIALVMSFATVAISSVSAAEISDETVGAANTVEGVGATNTATQVGAGSDVSSTGSTSGKVYFVKPEKWAGTIVYCHIYHAEDGSFFNWQHNKEKCT